MPQVACSTWGCAPRAPTAARRCAPRAIASARTSENPARATTTAARSGSATAGRAPSGAAPTGRTAGTTPSAAAAPAWRTFAVRLAALPRERCAKAAAAAMVSRASSEPMPRRRPVLRWSRVRLHEHRLLPGRERLVLGRQRLLHGQRVGLPRRALLRDAGALFPVHGRGGLLSRVDVREGRFDQRLLSARGDVLHDRRRLLLRRPVRGRQMPVNVPTVPLTRRSRVMQGRESTAPWRSPGSRRGLPGRSGRPRSAREAALALRARAPAVGRRRDRGSDRSSRTA